MSSTRRARAARVRRTRNGEPHAGGDEREPPPPRTAARDPSGRSSRKPRSRPWPRRRHRAPRWRPLGPVRATRRGAAPARSASSRTVASTANAAIQGGQREPGAAEQLPPARRADQSSRFAGHSRSPAPPGRTRPPNARPSTPTPAAESQAHQCAPERPSGRSSRPPSAAAASRGGQARRKRGRR